jgi:catechol 2,3-dioxygenase-like lactoylglutathione lyase family enzyme
MDIDHVQIAAPSGSEAHARTFSGEILGLDEIDKPAELLHEGGVWFALGPQELHIGIGSEFQPATKAHPAFRVRDRAALDTLVSALAGAGHPVESDGAIPRVDRFFVADPFGNRLEVLAYT